jgi:hypothetical protein
MLQHIVRQALELDLPIIGEGSKFADTSLDALTKRKFDVVFVWHYMGHGRLALPENVSADDHEGIARLVVEGTRQSDANRSTPILVMYLPEGSSGRKESIAQFKKAGANECFNLREYYRYRGAGMDRLITKVRQYL